MIERRDLDETRVTLARLIRAEAERTRTETRRVGVVPALMVSAITSALVTGAVMFMWGIFR